MSKKCKHEKLVTSKFGYTYCNECGMSETERRREKLGI